MRVRVTSWADEYDIRHREFEVEERKDEIEIAREELFWLLRDMRLLDEGRTAGMDYVLFALNPQGDTIAFVAIEKLSDG